MTNSELINTAAPGVPYFTPWQATPAGTALNPQPNNKPLPKLFTPLQIRGLRFQNRIMLSPLCQYSARDGHVSDWHLAHLGGIVSRGPGISMAEATGVTAGGRITPQCPGLWKASQVEAWARVVAFAHAQNQRVGVQLAHAGRKAGTVAPFLSFSAKAPEADGGWGGDEVVGPSAVAYDANVHVPREMTKGDIGEVREAFAKAAGRAVEAGFDFVEIHNAHGYLLHSFLSPVANRRTDEYGGSWENRTRLTLEVVDAVRAAIPEDMPLFLRISATDFLEEVEGFGPEKSWTLEDTIALAEILAERGVDVLDVSAGGQHPAQKIKGGPAHQAPFAKAIKERVGDKMLVATVGTITDGKMANQLLEDGLDIAAAGRLFQKNPGLVWAWADDLDVQIENAQQIGWGFMGRGKKGKKINTFLTAE
ncbi:fmn-linked oxidoreductase [Diplodia corticola]|uniref:Fmn-linked oxidoreductase n=1 Tax=Diplodia corticola TaxID=236234 RepID=A0A1J9RL65_9PEZI|nr:fmn-linked oxidoreductase [Diplodia corticola]OJD40714.1 fmn-linked oxidoreductase [Diplodia corticola]